MNEWANNAIVTREVLIWLCYWLGFLSDFPHAPLLYALSHKGSIQKKKAKIRSSHVQFDPDLLAPLIKMSILYKINNTNTELYCISDLRMRPRCRQFESQNFSNKTGGRQNDSSWTGR